MESIDLYPTLSLVAVAITVATLEADASIPGYVFNADYNPITSSL